MPEPDLKHTANSPFKHCPVLGVGLGLRSSLLEDTLAATDLLDWLEITPENYMGRGGSSQRQLERIKAAYPLVSHGVSLSIGSVDRWDEHYLTALEALFETINPPWFSDHLCFSGIQGRYFNDLMPLPRTWEAVAHCVQRIRAIQERFERPFLVENISYYLDYPDSELSEVQFLGEILEQSDCGLLLDVNNLYVNHVNRPGQGDLEPHSFLAALPLERVVQIHVAGHNYYPEGGIDTHGSPVRDNVWELLDWTLSRCNPCGIMLERDLDIPPFAELTPELRKLRQLWDRHYSPQHLLKGASHVA